VPTIAELGLPDVVIRLVDQPSGLILVTGPTGSGKSTTLAAMVDHVNRNRRCHILTIEDPIEYVHQQGCGRSHSAKSARTLSRLPVPSVRLCARILTS
jgi:twitching motility protein PilT